MAGTVYYYLSMARNVRSIFKAIFLWLELSIIFSNMSMAGTDHSMAETVG